MAQPSWIELVCGPSKGFIASVWMFWLLAAAAVMYSTQHYAWPWLAAAVVALIVLRPGSGSALRSRCAIRINPHGVVRIGSFEGTWQTAWRGNRLAVLLKISRAGRTQSVLVCASLNRPEDYRHLLVWCRYPRCGTHASSPVSE